MTTDALARSLTAVDTLSPAAGEVVAVLEGEVLVFALGTDGRRTPLCTVPAGGVVVGCGVAANGESLLVTGLPGTQVSVTSLDNERVDTSQLQDWIGSLAASLTQGRWPQSLVPIASAGSMLAPGETVGQKRDDERPVWVSLTAGSARLCGMEGATLEPSDGSLPLPRGSWLTAGLRCRIVVGLVVAEEPAAVAEEERVVAPTGCRDLGEHLWPDGRVPGDVLVEERRVDLQLEGHSGHVTPLWDAGSWHP